MGARASAEIGVDPGPGHARARRITADDHRLLGPRRLVRRAQPAARVLRPGALLPVTETYLSHISVIVSFRVTTYAYMLPFLVRCRGDGVGTPRSILRAQPPVASVE